MASAPQVPGLAWVERTDDPVEAWDALSPAEQAAAEKFCPSRRSEFATARLCARGAMQQVGGTAAPLRRGRAGEPLWPEGLVGSISHCRGMRAAVAARADTWAGVGIDVEPDLPLPPGVAEFVLTPAERGRLAAGPLRRANADRLTFCVKEAVYKACWALGGQRLAFGDTDTAVDEDGAVTVTLARALPSVAGRPVHTVHGRWTSSGGVLRVAMTIGAPAG